VYSCVVRAAAVDHHSGDEEQDEESHKSVAKPTPSTRSGNGGRGSWRWSSSFVSCLLRRYLGIPGLCPLVARIFWPIFSASCSPGFTDL
jgi:hypothetical protein